MNARPTKGTRTDTPAGAMAAGGARACGRHSAPVAAATPPEGFNLLRLPGVRALVRWGGFPYVVQAAMLAVFIALAVLSWGVYAPPGANPKLFAKTNLVTLLIWGVWWPTMIWVAVLLGRAWCMVCPLELVSNVSERLARRLGVRQRPLRPWVAAGAVIVALYALIQLLVAGAHINRVPAYTSLFLIGLLATALLTGLVLKDRAFCRGFCPVGLLLGTYGRGGMLAVRAGLAATCWSCTGKDCVLACNRTLLDARSCPSLLNPQKLNSNKDCLACGQCLKACEPGNMQLLLRRPFPATDAREATASWPLTLFVMLVSGFVTWELLAEWPTAEAVFLSAPTLAAVAFGWSEAGGWLEGVWALAVVPLLLWSALAGVVRLLEAKETLGDLWRRMALPIAVVIAAGHMSKGLAKFVSWAPFVPRAWHDPSGMDTMKALAAATLPPPAPFFELSTVAGIGLVLISLSLRYSVREYRLASAGARTLPRSFLPVAALACAFVLILAGWVAQ